MQPDQRVMSILANARKQPPQQRDDFVRFACGNDSDLIRELTEALLWEDRMGSFLQKPLLNLAALARPFQAGEVISQRFEIVREIGQGGMGIVYEAFDQKRKLRIAIKAARPGFQRLLSPELEGALQVRHHNICLVNEIHTAQTKYGEIDFLTMELLEGETLCARLLRGGRFPCDEARNIICQICAGLRAAHDSEVIHRDLKSANIILSQNFDGNRRAVITDFGLASGLTLSSGEMGGTPAYMAPELWKGEKASKASDIYALGVVMYEMVTGAQPFPSNGSEPEPLKRRLAPPSRLREGLDPRWDSVILHCLDPLPRARPDATEIAARLRERSQSAAEIRIALEKILRERSQSAAGVHTTLEKVQRVAAGRYLRRLKKVVVTSLAALLVAACAVGIWWWRRPLAQRAFQKYSMTPLTSSGNVAYAEISPDGKYLAYRDGDVGKESLWLQELATSKSARVLGQASGLGAARFTPDGNYLYYEQGYANERTSKLYRIPVLGGAPEEIATDVLSSVDFSPDGRRIVFARHTDTENYLVTANADGSSERRILTLKTTETIDVVAWALDGQTIAFGIDEADFGDANCIAVISTNGGKERRLRDMFFIVGMTWLPDQSGLLIVGTPSGTEESALWILSYPDGGLRRITSDLVDYRSVSLSHSSGHLVTVQKQMDSSLWVAPALKPSQGMQLRVGAGNSDGYGGVSWLPDGRLVYARGRDKAELWLTDRDGSNRQQLTRTNASAYDPSATRAGPTVIFAYCPPDRAKPNIWRIDSDGTNLRQITNDSVPKRSPEISPDEKWITYFSMQGPWMISLSGGEPANLDPHGGFPTISPDGRWIAFGVWDEKEKKAKIEIVAADGKLPPRFLPFISEPQMQSADVADLQVRWKADGKAITYVRTQNGVSNIWSQPIDGSPAKQLTNFTSMLIWCHAWSPDGKYLVIARGNFSRDAVMLTDQR